MTPSPTTDPASFVLEIQAGTPSPQALAWLQDGFRRHLAGEPLTAALGFHRYSRGLRDAIRHARIRRSIIQAANLLPAGSTPHSKAKAIRTELLRLLRTWPRSTPRTPLDAAVFGIIESAGGSPPTGLTTLRDIIATAD